MHRIQYFLMGLIVASTLLLCQPNSGTAYAQVAHERGIAVLASSIGKDFSPEELARFVQQGRFAPVIIDWAWITHHWDRTNFAAVNRFIGLMAAQKVPVAAMYRPRFLSSPTAATQVGTEGKPSVDHAEICYSDASARRWGYSWGERILEKCPNFKEIIIYNPVDQCQCPKCSVSRLNGRYTTIMSFLSEAKSSWLIKHPGLKLGVVSMPYPEFWTAGVSIVDVAHPYLCIRENVDPTKEITNLVAVRAILKEKMGSSLAKVTWEEGERASIDQLKTVDDLAAREGISYFFWTFETLFNSSLYDSKAVIQALGIGSPVASTSTKTTTTNSSKITGASYAKDNSTRSEAEALLAGIQRAEHGAAQFAAIDTLVRKANESDDAGRRTILSVVIATMNDKSLGVGQRWPCCYVISGCEGVQGVTDLIQVLLQDESSIMRRVAAEALGRLSETQAARDALLQSACRETDSGVRETIARYLGASMPALNSSPDPATSTGVEELSPSGPPQPPPGPVRPVTKPLPWPFPGDYKAQNLFNNYQTCTDQYIHCGLDLLHPAGTPVTAVASGYVAAIWTQYPDTGDFFIVTPIQGGDTGWCYTHIDPRTFTFREGDFIKQGQQLGKLVKFSPNEKYSMDHLHLHYVSFTKGAAWHTSLRSLLDPLYFFDWKDTVAPSFLPLKFVLEGTMQEFSTDAAGVTTVKGKVDILAAVTDSAYIGQKALLGVSVVMLSISDGTHTMQKLVIDHRGDVGDVKQTKPLYISRDETNKLFGTRFDPYYQTLRVTKTDGDGIITPRDEREFWDTTARESRGRALWPDGKYSVNVYAWDIAGNRGVTGAIVQVKNGTNTRF